MLIDTIQSAILEKKELLLKLKSNFEPNNTIEVFLQPYIYGKDVLQFGFVWGYLIESGIFYKIFTDSIINAETIEIPYKSLENTSYQQVMYEEHICVLEGLRVKYIDSSFCLNN